MPHSDKPPTRKQMRYLRSLAEQRGESFAYPSSSAEASAAIDRLRGRPRQPVSDRRRERLDVSRAMAARGDASSVRDSEIVGYGSSAHWR
jgi:hypothetical protein